MYRRAILTTICAFVLFVSGGAADSLAQEAETTQRPADIRVGACASLGDVVMPLDSLFVPTGETQGQGGATPVEQSVTTLPLLLDDILATGHAVAVHASPEQVGTPVACGEIGGALGEDGSLAIGLNAMNGSKISGAAYFAPTPEGDGITVTLLLIDERAGRRADGGVGGGSEPAASDPAASDTATGNDISAVDDASGVDNATAPPAAAPSPAPATAGLDGVSTISADNADGKNAKPPRNKDKATADRDANGNAGDATTNSDTNDTSNGKERDGERANREGGARAGEDGGGANG